MVSDSCRIRLVTARVLDPGKKLQYRTFDSKNLGTELAEVISEIHENDVRHMTILSDFGDSSRPPTCRRMEGLSLYYRKRSAVESGVMK